MANISAILNELMQRKGATAYQIAKDTGGAITQPAISRILKGDRMPRYKTLGILSDYFGITISQLLGDAPLPSGDGAYSGTVNECPEDFDEQLWIKVPSLITEVDKDLIKDHFGPREITMDIVENINSPHIQKIWQYLYYAMLANVTKQDE